MKWDFTKLIRDMIPVILGILIALFINNWNENRDDQKFVNKIMQAIDAEIKENKSELDSVIIEHKAFTDTINLYINDEEVKVGDILNKTNGLTAVIIKNSAAKAFVNIKPELINYEILSVLTNINEEKIYMNQKLENLSNFIYQNMDSSESNKKELFKITINDLRVLEEDLFESHLSYLKIRREAN